MFIKIIIKQVSWHRNCKFISTKHQLLTFKITIMGILTWIIFGLIAGAIAKAIHQDLTPEVGLQQSLSVLSVQLLEDG